MSIEAMKQALEALEYMHTEKCDYMRRNKLGDPLREDAARLAIPAITALRTAIEQAEKQDGACQQCGGQGCVACDARKQEPVAIRPAVYGAWKEPPAAQRQWVGLTDEEIKEIEANTEPFALEFARAIEAKLREKNGGQA